MYLLTIHLLRSWFRKMSMKSFPLIVVLGSTGTGKSKLAVSLARRFGGEVINADAMQVYRGLEILTNQLPVTEQKGCPHHLLGFLDPLKRFSVVDFRNRTLPLIASLKTSEKLPIVVGGTHYYIESVLWQVLMEPSSNNGDERLVYDSFGRRSLDGSSSESEGEDPEIMIEGYPKSVLMDPERYFTGADSMVLHDLLKRIDPDAANALHFNDRRKIMRSIQVYAQHGKKHSYLLGTQKSAAGGSVLGGPLRYLDAIILWLQCEQEVLDGRLDDRVDDMVKSGLVEELRLFYRGVPTETEIDYAKGIFQSIGVKEFHDLLSPNANLNDDEEKLTANAIDTMKARTRKYARKQVKWIQNRFLSRSDRQLPPIFALDATYADQWEQVEDAAFSIIEDIINGVPPRHEPLKQTFAQPDTKTTNTCAVCSRSFVSLKQWREHLASNTHRRSRKAKQKREKSLVTAQQKPSAVLQITQPARN